MDVNVWVIGLWYLHHDVGLVPIVVHGSAKDQVMDRNRGGVYQWMQKLELSLTPSFRVCSVEGACSIDSGSARGKFVQLRLSVAVKKKSSSASVEIERNSLRT